MSHQVVVGSEKGPDVRYKVLRGESKPFLAELVLDEILTRC